MSPHRSVFRDESKLDINYIPRKMPHREEEHHLLLEFFDFLLHFPDKMAQRVIITGEVGTGKTALAQRFGADITLRANKLGVNLRYVHVNCREYRGKLFLIMQHVLNIFRPTFPKRGYSSEEVLGTLLQTLDEEDTYLILALDEFETLINHEGSDSVYRITRLQEMRPNKPQRISLISIMRNLKPIEKLDASARSTLQQNLIKLSNYSRSQLVDILNDRVSMAFEFSTISEDVVNLVSEHASSEGGNARFAIELLWRAGKYADAENLGSVAPECVRKAVSSIFPSVKRGELASLGRHELLFLLGVARLFREDERASVPLSEIETMYAVVCEEFNETPNSHTQIWKYVQLLSAMGILRAEVTGTGMRGRSTYVSLPSIPATELEKELADTLQKE